MKTTKKWAESSNDIIGDIKRGMEIVMKPLMKTTKKGAESENIKIGTAQKSRQRLGIGEKIGNSYLLTAEQWEQVKKNIRGLAIITQSAFSRKAGVSRQTVSNLVKSGELVLDRDGGVDMDNEGNIKYLEGKDGL